MAGGNDLFKGLSKSLIDPSAQLPAEPERILMDGTPMVASRKGTHMSDPAHQSASSQGRKWSQEDQNKYDAQAKKKAMKELVNTWQDRLQLISVITTFFAAIEAQLLGIVTPADKTNVPRIAQAAATGLSSALVVHVFAAIISFFAAFFLVRFRLHEATHEELKVELGGSPKSSAYDGSQVFSTNPHLEPVGPFRRGQPPTHLLDHCHTLSMMLTLVGFMLAVLGLMCLMWSSLPPSASVASTACMILCCLATLVAVFWPASGIHVQVDLRSAC